jgi:hypothetical protein
MLVRFTLVLGWLAACAGEVVVTEPEPFGELPPRTPQPEPPLEPSAEPPAPEPPGEPPVDPAPPSEHDARFVGLWIVDQPYHATYEATYYELVSDGTLLEGSSVVWGGPNVPTGRVAKMGTDLVCSFGSAWFSLDPSTLVIVGDCSDGQPREIVLGFNADPSSNASDAGVTILSVGGETDWHHPWPEWRFRKCPAGATERTCPAWG